MTIIFLDAGSNDTQEALSQWSFTTTPAVASSTSQFRTGTRSLLADSTGSNSACYVGRFACLADAGRCISVPFYFGAVPSTSAAIMRATPVGHISDTWQLKFTTSQTLSFLDGGGTLHKDGSTIISLNAWHRISVSFVFTTTTNWHVKVYVDGALEIDITNADFTMTRIVNEAIFIGWFTAPGASKQLWFQDVFIDDRSDLSDCNDIRVAAKRPFSNGATNAFTTGIGADGAYGSGHALRTNERPRSDSNGWSFAVLNSSGTKVEEYTIEGAAVGDVDLSNATIIGLLGWIQANVSNTASITGHIILAGSATLITMAASSTRYIVASTTSTYPNTNTAIGMDAATSAISRTFSLYEAGILIAFTFNMPPGVGPLGLQTSVVPQKPPRQADYIANLASLFGSDGSTPPGVQNLSGPLSKFQQTELIETQANIITPPAILPAGAGAGVQSVDSTRRPPPVAPVPLISLDSDYPNLNSGNLPAGQISYSIQRIIQALLTTLSRDDSNLMTPAAIPPAGVQVVVTQRVILIQLTTLDADRPNLSTPPAILPAGVQVATPNQPRPALLSHIDSDLPNLDTPPAILPAGKPLYDLLRIRTVQIELLETQANIVTPPAILPAGVQVWLPNRPYPVVHTQLDRDTPNLDTTPAILPSGSLVVQYQRVVPVQLTHLDSQAINLLLVPVLPMPMVLSQPSVIRRQLEWLQTQANLLTPVQVLPVGSLVSYGNFPRLSFLSFVDSNLPLLNTIPVTPTPSGVQLYSTQTVARRQLDWLRSLANTLTPTAILPAGSLVSQGNHSVVTPLDWSRSLSGSLIVLPPGVLLYQGNSPHLSFLSHVDRSANLPIPAAPTPPSLLDSTVRTLSRPLSWVSSGAFLLPTQFPVGSSVVSTPRVLSRFLTHLSPSISVPFLSFIYPLVPVIIELSSGLLVVEFTSNLRLLDLADGTAITDMSSGVRVVPMPDGDGGGSDSVVIDR